MDDLNLLPDELRKKDAKPFNKGNFNNVEFTSGQELQKDPSKENTVFEKKAFSWFGPKSDNKPNIKKNISNDSKANFVSNNINLRNNNDNDFIGNEKKDVNLNNINLDAENKAKINPNHNLNERPLARNINQTQQGKLITQNTKKSNIFFDKIKKFFSKQSKSDGKKPDVNLLPESLSLLSTQNIFFLFILTFVVSVMIIFVVVFALDIYKLSMQKQADSLDNQLNEYVANLSTYEGVIKDVENLQAKSESIKSLFDHHIYWTKFFEAIENNTLPNVRFNSFAGGLNGNLTLSAIAPDYTTVVKQWMHLKRAKDFAKNVIITGANLSQTENKTGGNVSFNITLDLVDNIFYKTKK